MVAVHRGLQGEVGLGKTCFNRFESRRRCRNKRRLPDEIYVHVRVPARFRFHRFYAQGRAVMQMLQNQEIPDQASPNEFGERC